ncbi:hypothetical protein V4T79_003997 [Vibrio parahaemolyticus]|jgi:hypothetical protein|uniref:hypothetical protein n=1 Tax=Vibrio parahaemolyticus TaxID=670 RepID=UPI00084B332B|nr:hypothetical protein [Vibrio parahaemolyticus]EHU0318120.1 hypothetical protein [Vibrio parahaemolyticus]MBM4846371.1 hypothetical protein [Vibrio parahaemolyticus]ODW76217.1 hypothetical protein BBL92_12490 [Vibrio parahaemolyticus]HAS6494473.1 hypothetical protein [Vibrio parahaemolyticus]HAS6507309.1 hypothetical protein [Vibrio parahaemolyticus]
MLKVKLYQAATYITKEQFYKRLEQNLYSDEQGFGFELLDDSEDNFVAQFIERTIRKQEFELPDGEVSEIETVSYIKVKFGIRFDTKHALYVINPPRSMKYPFEMIRALFGSDNGLKPVDLDLKKLLDVFSAKYDYVIRSMSLSNIQCDPNTIAKTKIASTKDLIPFYLEHYSETPAVIDTVHMVVNGIDTELSRTGRFRVHEANLQTFMLMIDHSFQ